MNPTNNYIEIDNVKLKIEFSNDSEGQPTIIFLHDSYGCIELWRDFPDKLCYITSCNKLVYDRQGYGKSDPFATIERNLDYLEIEADILHKIITKLNLNNVIIFGHSDGGSIGLIAAAKYSNLISGLITEGAHVFVEDISYAGLRRALIDYKTTDLKGKLAKYHGEKTDEVFWAWMNTWSSRKFSVWNIEHLLPNINCPALIIQGENDEYGSIKQVDTIVLGMRGLTTKLIVPNAEHTPHKTHSNIILSETKKFISLIKAFKNNKSSC